MSDYKRLIRFIPKSPSSTPSSNPLIGEPQDPSLDIGLASYSRQPISVNVFSGSSILSPGERTGEVVEVESVLSPLGEGEVGTIRCVGLNYVAHAKEVGMALPEVPTLFMKPSTSLASPYPTSTTPIPLPFHSSPSTDYESELVIIISKPCKNVPESSAMEYVWGFTAANDISSRVEQFKTSQWCFSKGFDGACPIGPCAVRREAVGEGDKWREMKIRGERNGVVAQESGMDDLIFSIPKIVSFLSQGTTLKAGTIILTGTPAGVGWSQTPKNLLEDGDEFRVWMSHGVGTLISKIEYEK